jgi:hypothetical protein
MRQSILWQRKDSIGWSSLQSWCKSHALHAGHVSSRLRAAAVSTLDRLKVLMKLKETVCANHKNNKFLIISATMTQEIYIIRRMVTFMCRISQYLSLQLHRAFRRVTWLVYQPIHTHKIVYIKTSKLAPTCFDHAIIIRELRCSLLKWWWSHDRNMSEQF